ncbi:hypothetical protein [Pelagibacterium sp.]|uniref:hypothetical protein n=1 Tax=Pelagibacterium sp. TaxID=1967288 RepID=UPI003A8FCF60
MPAKNTKTIKTMQSQSGHAVGVFFPDLSSIQRLELEAGVNSQFPPTTEGGVWYLYVPAGKTALLIDGPMSVAEEQDINLVLARAMPIVGPVYFPVAFDEGNYGYLVPDGAAFEVHCARVANNGGA